MMRISENRPDVSREALGSEIQRQVRRSGSGRVGVGSLPAADLVEPSAPPRGPSTTPTITVESAAPQPSLFGELVQGRSSLELVAASLAQPVGLDRDLSPDTRTMMKLNELETKATELASHNPEAAGRLFAAAGRMRLGVMLALSDGIGAQTTATTKVPRDLSAKVGESIMAEKTEAKMLAAAQGAMLGSKARFPLGMDITAFVQAVLRECYLMQNEILKDYADKVKFFTDMKKRIRAQLADARALALAVKDGADIPEELWWIDRESGEESMSYRSTGPGKPQADEDDVETPPPGGSDQGGNDRVDAGPPTVDVASTFFDGPMVAPPTTPEGVRALQLLVAALQSHGGTSAELRDVLAGLLSFGVKGSDLDPQARELRDAFFAIPGWGSSVKDNDSMIDALIGAVAQNAAGLDDATVGALAKGLASAAREWGDEKGCQGPAWVMKTALGWMLPNLTDSQLAGVEAAVGEADWTSLSMIADGCDLGAAARLDKRLREYEAAYATLPDLLKTAPFLQVGELYAQMLHEGPGGQAAALLGPALRRLLSSEVVSFANAIVGTPEGLALCTTLFGENAVKPAEVDASAGGYSDGGEVDGPTGDVNDGSGDTGGLETGPEMGNGSAGGPEDRNAYMADYVKNLEEQLATAGEDGQLANVDLQNALQQQQQTLQMMSNVSKMLHDTALSIIRKIGG
jgi:hypothetical protein